MILDIVHYGHPVLRQPGKPIVAVTPEIQRLAADMIETMHAAHGIGLAAQQVGQARQLAVLDLREVTDRPSTLEWEGKAADIEQHMPLVLVNPEIEPEGPPVDGPEGCLSFPELYADVRRPDSITVKALDEHGQTIRFRCSGLLARAIQHENDHLRGVLFIDRMTNGTRSQLQPQLDQLQTSTKNALARRK